MTSDRRRLSMFGESIAATFLGRRGATIVGRNVRIGRGELDIVALLDGVLVAVEVKTIGPDAGAVEPIDRIGPKKLQTVRRLAGRLAAERRRSVRVDYVGVRLDRSGVVVNWRTAVA